jgi:hypothetical protein
MMLPFARLFPELASAETRTATLAPLRPGDPPDFPPADEYAFFEHYCADRKCDCRRVLIYVYARHAAQHVATISHAFDPPPPGARIRQQTFLDPILPQTQWAPALLDLFAHELFSDQDYRQRLRLHYRMFKSVVTNPFHPAHHKLRA